ncbi:MAG: hypothetical protein VB071_00765, partial [Lawsonibacter sp.]|nr:hypothetical protein [Lawsonibacter sp.]
TWNATKKYLPADTRVHLHLFVSYDLEYHNTQSTDYTNLSQDIVDAFDGIVFVGAKNALRSMERLKSSGTLTQSELKCVFGAGYAGKRNAVLFAAIERRMDYLLFLDDDEYPMAVTNNHDVCLWSGQQVFLSHLQEIGSADSTNGYHCGYVSPIPQISFNDVLTEQDFSRFIEAISNDIINWDSIKRLIGSGGVTYASTEVLRRGESEEVLLRSGCKFISGGNLCINLTVPERTLPFFNPPGARGEDTFLSSMLHDRTVRKVPCYTFHDGFSIYPHLLDGTLPIHLSAISADTSAVVTRFVHACIGWVRYKPLLVYITAPDDYERRMMAIRTALKKTLPKLASYFHEERFLTISAEFEKYCKNVTRSHEQFLASQQAWKKMIRAMPT